MTTTTAATWLPEVWSALATVTYRQNSILPPLMDRRWEPELGVGRGDTVNIPSFSQNNRSYVTKRSSFGTGAAITFNAVTEAQVQLVVNQMAYYAFRMPVELSVQVMSKYEKLLTDAAGPAIANQIDYELASDNTNGFDAFTAIGADNIDVTEDVVLEGEQVLNENHAPLSGRYFVFSPATYTSLRGIEGFKNSLYATANGSIPGDKGPGYVGKIGTLECYMHADLKAGSSGKKNFIGHTEAIAYCEQKSIKIEKGMNIADGGFNEYLAYVVYGFKQVKSDFGREVDGK